MCKNRCLPFELLIRSRNEFISEGHETCTGKILQLCREERERRIIKEVVDKTLGHNGLSALDTVGEVVSRSSGCNSLHKNTAPIPYGFVSKSGGKSLSSVNSGGGKRSQTVNSMISSLGDLIHSPATVMQLEKLTGDIKKTMSVTVSEKDRKIAALMLVKRQEEQALLTLCQQEARERWEALKKEAAQRAQTEKERRKALKHSMQRWCHEMEALKRTREHQEEELARLREQEVLLQGDRWLRLTEELEAKRREKTEATRREAEARKRCQEKSLRDKATMENAERERERQVALEREQKAKKIKVTQQRRVRKRLSQENHRELLRHVLFKKQAEQQVEEEEAAMRTALEKRLHRSWEKQARATKERLKELQERGARETEQIRRARLNAELQNQQQVRDKQLLVQVSQHRMKKARELASDQIRARAQQARQHNVGRQLCHRQLRDRVQREEEALREARERHITAKERRSRQLQKQRERTQEEARRVVRASFHMRERVRQQTQCRTFDRMAMEAQLSAAMACIKL